MDLEKALKFLEEHFMNLSNQSKADIFKDGSGFPDRDLAMESAAYYRCSQIVAEVLKASQSIPA